ncbi:hypothetical protein [Brevibacillus borstelensis]|uniref:hypothetical protein n=1 Tax=Brevibacillus borstelensis TaxID=45462 RepID=UPI0030C2FA49
MRELQIDGKQVRVRATPLALLYYKQEFKTDLLGDLMKMQNIRDDPSQIDIVAILQLIWAMAKADSLGKPFPSFVEWVGSLENFDITDQGLFAAVMEEAAEGFFRSKAQAGTETGQAKGTRAHRNQSARRG